MKQNVINNIQISNITVQTFAVSGTYTPTTGMKFCIVNMVGGGGGGGGSLTTGNNECSAGGGGGSAAYAQVLFTAAEIGASQPVTVGLAGTGSSGGNGVTRSPSALGTAGSLMFCDSGGGGGVGGLNSTDNGFALPGTGGGAIVNIGTAIITLSGESGQTAGYAGKDDYGSSGRGGSSHWGNSAAEYHTIGGF